jgi:hypothetical protein
VKKQQHISSCTMPDNMTRSSIPSCNMHSELCYSGLKNSFPETVTHSYTRTVISLVVLERRYSHNSSNSTSKVHLTSIFSVMQDLATIIYTSIGLVCISIAFILSSGGTITSHLPCNTNHSL